MDFTPYDKLTVGILIVDENGYIIYINKAYSSAFNINSHEAIGKHVRDVIEHTKLDGVAKTGIPELRVWQKTKKGYLFGNRVPLYVDGVLKGAIAEMILRDTDELEQLNVKLKEKEDHIRYLTDKLASSEVKSNTSMIYQSQVIDKIVKKIQKVASLDTTILISGETGTGKEVIADMIYKYSDRFNKPFVKINCAAIPNDLIESELFGYEKGAFTGANQKGKIGKFELANHGILFLDEISSMPLMMQSKLLRVIQNKELERLGGNERIKIDVKIIAATNEDLLSMVEKHEFREDLYYRLNVVNIDLPPLRDRKEDIVILANCFLQEYCFKFNKKNVSFTFNAAKFIEEYSWPGNVRELKNAMERLAIMCEGSIITENDIVEILRIHKDVKPKGTLKYQLDQLEKDILINELRRANGNKAMAAHVLGINRTTLYSKMEKYRLMDESHKNKLIKL